MNQKNTMNNKEYIKKIIKEKKFNFEELKNNLLNSFFNKKEGYCFEDKKEINNINKKKFKIELIRWLYKNQSKEQREHYANRIFVVLVNRKDLSESWKLKAELTKIKNEIELYLKEFKKGNEKLITFFDKEKNNRFCSDIIYVFD